MKRKNSYLDLVKKETRESEGHYRNADQGEQVYVEEMTPYETDIIFKVERLVVANAPTGPCKLFGASDGFDEQANTDNGIKVTYLSGDVNKLKRKLVGNGIHIEGIAFEVTEQAQYANKFTVKEDKLGQGRHEWDFFPIVTNNGYLTNPLFREKKDFHITVTEDTSIEFEFTAGDYMMIIFKMDKTLNFSNLLHGKPVIRKANPYNSI